MSEIRVKRSVHIEASNYLEDAVVASIGYVSKDENILLEVVRIAGHRGYHFLKQHQEVPAEHIHPNLLRKSVDNGRTWETVGEWNERQPLEGKRYLSIAEPNYVVHPETGTLIRFYMTREEIDGVLPWEKESPFGRTGKAWTEISRDGGKTWKNKQQVIVQGDEYNETDWAPGITYGVNTLIVEGVEPLDLPDGRFLIPGFATHKAAPGENVFDRWNCQNLIGRWREDGSGVDWSTTIPATVGLAGSNSGGDEPSVALLDDGRLFMTMRVRVDPNDGTTIPSGKFYTLSSDMGKTWSEPDFLKYEDGSQVYTPACLAHVFRSSKNGRLYIITNILDEPTYGCDPRSTLQIAEIDMQTFRIQRDSVTVIESRQDGQNDLIRFSNWRRYEDRETKDIVLYMTGCPGDEGRHEDCKTPPHAYRYDIILPE